MDYPVTELYKVQQDKPRVWRIFQTDKNHYRIEYGLLNGAMQHTDNYVPCGKANRTTQQQIELQINSAIERQLQNGYHRTIGAAFANPHTFVNDLLRPMLALQLKRVKTVDWSSTIMQPKFDGHRCMIGNVNGEIIAWTRRGNLIETIPHITDELQLPEGTILDGELYIHGKPLQHISSLVKRLQDESAKLKFMCFDLVADTTFAERFQLAGEIIRGTEHCILSPFEAIQKDEIPARLNAAVEEGYEGLMVRQNEYAYAPGKRHKSLIKVKKLFDAEFKIIDILRSKEGWAILVCETYDVEELGIQSGKIFNVSAPGSIAEKVQIWNNRQAYIGRDVNVQYAQLTNAGIPFHAVATRICDGKKVEA